MSWITDHTRVWRIIALVLLLLAIAGPWAYDQINVPAEYPCSPPFVRLEGDFCGLPVTGAYMVFALGSEIARVITGLVMGSLALAASGRGLLILLIGFLILLPTVSTLLMIFWGDHRWLQITHLAVLFLAGGLVLWALAVAPELRAIRLWGPWLYFSSIFVMLILEIICFAFRKGRGQAR